ncbi:hypothetical protein D6D04_04232 [Aureobasidium pullulans]|nr:hypothetical protein D6D04_04232 [Aureobasidium pullulans]
MHQLATGTYKIVWTDEEEMEMNAGVPLLERAVALGKICEELLSAIMTVWNSGQNIHSSPYSRDEAFFVHCTDAGSGWIFV